MAPTPYILPRETRESAILVGNGTVGPFGPSLYKIFDTADVAVFAKALGEDVFTDVTAGCTIAKVNPAAAYDYFTVTFGAAVPATTSWYHQARRTAERSVAVTKAGTINSDQLEKELSKQASAQSELRRDVDRAVRVMPGTDPVTIIPGADGELVKFEDGNAVGSGENVDTITGSTAAAAASAAAAAASATNAGNSATAAAASASSAANDAGILASLVAGFGAIWNTILQTTTTAAAWVQLQVLGYLTTIAALKALAPSVGMMVYVSDGDRRGFFKWTAGDFSSQIAADTLEGFYVKATSVNANAGAWVRSGSPMVLDVEWFSSVALANTTNDAQPALMAAYNLLAAITGTTEGSIGTILATRGKYRLGGSLSFSKPVKFVCDNFLEYTPTANAAVIIGAATPIGGRNTGYDIQIAGLRAINGNTAAPTGVNAAGCSGIEIRNCQFSQIRIGRIIAFTKYGFWGNQSNNVYPLQHCQDNVIWLGDVAYCGTGVYTESVSAALGAFQVNEVHIQNSFGNWINYSSPTGDTNTNNNSFHFNAADADTGGGNIFINGGWNDFYFGFTDGTMTLRPGAVYNRIFGHNVTFTDSSGNTTNEISDGQNGTVTLKRFKTSGVSPIVRLQSTAAGASSAELLEFYRSGTRSNNDKLGGASWYHDDDAAAKRKTAEMRVDVPTVAAANLNSRFAWDTTVGNVYGEKMVLWQGLTLGSPAGGDKGAGTINISSGYYVAGVKVLGAQATGWTAGTGTALKGAFAAYAGQTHTASYVQATIQALDNAARDASQRVKAIEDALRTHGLIN
ncbi:hypothetical protein [Mesorhizobium sp.]|uniref:hypothetical protein n=1 Tax=Mesorhizobium sp. TaxID=1871066 RepID=UPI000FE79C89|nr:hypothetical protein [Mesorhizobium sp.]RWI96097.1 MAG: hypothetical protein EOR21_08705 [Mesorhizobium sp.]